MRRLQRYLPIVLIALMVQILAPIGACWAAAIAASDPLSAAAICHDAGAGGQDQGGQHDEHGSACAICCLSAATAFVDTPKLESFAVPYRQTVHVAWHDQRFDFSSARSGSNARARAPPSAS